MTSSLHNMNHHKQRKIIAAIFMVLIAVVLASCFFGQYTFAFWQQGHFSDIDQFILLDLRIPRVLSAIFAGACLSISGCIFQRMSHNSLASPDIIGLNIGASTGGLTVILILGQSNLGVSLGTLIGGILTVTLIYIIAHFSKLKGQWIILTGIAISAMLAAVNDYLITRADVDDAITARSWLYGSLQGITWIKLDILMVCGLALLIASLLMARHLDIIEMGDDLAVGLGMPLKPVKGQLLLIAVALTAVVIACAGPIGFVALVAPQLARRLCRGKNNMLVVAMLGALLCVISDLIARNALAPFQIPIGLVTSMIGGAYLIWLLQREWNMTK